MKENKNKTKTVSRGRRYSPGEKAQILQDAEAIGVPEAAEKHRCSKWTVYDWRKRDARRAKRDQAKQQSEALSGSPEKPPGNETRASSVQEERHRLILEIWRSNPGLGPSQIRNQMKRRGFRVSVSTVRAEMEEHGYVQPKARRKERAKAYEAVRPLQLYHFDFVHFFIHRQKQCMLLMLDDYSRFIPGFVLLESEQADGVIDTFETAVARYGRPEAVMTDRGAAFHSWRGVSRFERLLEELSIDHYLATKPQVNGKAEALAATFQKELTRTVEFTDLTEARQQVHRWVQFYNYKRTHHALGGLLVPADRFHGWQEETMKRIEQGNGADMLDILSPETRGLELFKVVSRGGQPAVYLMGQKVFG